MTSILPISIVHGLFSFKLQKIIILVNYLLQEYNLPVFSFHIFHSLTHVVAFGGVLVKEVRQSLERSLYEKILELREQKVVIDTLKNELNAVSKKYELGISEVGRISEVKLH